MKKIMFLFEEHLDMIDWTEVMETSRDTLRWNNAGSLTFVKWIGENPECIDNILEVSKYHIYDLEDALEILRTDEWVDLSECDGCPCTEYYKSEGMEI